MPPDRLVITEMIEAATRIIELAGDRPTSDIEGDRERHEAMMWNFTVLGEAASQVSDATKAAHADVQWADPVRLRNRIVHGYWSIDTGILLDTARDDLPSLAASLRRVLDGLEQEG